MEVAAIILAALVIVGTLLWMLDRRGGQDVDHSVPASENEAPDTTAADNDTAGEECCGQHYACEKDSLLTALSEKVEYYDDEYLDRFSGRDASGYTEAEKEEFRDVMLTLLPDDLAGWGRSIQLRSINLPDDVRDEFIMLIDEQRKHG